MLQPIGDQVVVQLESLPARGAIWTPEQDTHARTAIVRRSGTEEFQPGERVIVSMRQATLVGDELLLPVGGILARLDV